MDVTDEKHLNPLGSVVHAIIMGFITVLFGVAAVALHVYGDVHNHRINDGVGMAIFGMIVSLVFTINELSTIRKRNSQR